MTLEQVEILRDKALAQGSAPCNHLSGALVSIRTALAEGNIGRPLIVYAEMDDGFIARSPYRQWKNVSGAPWPYEDEFEVGCTLEHAGYYLTWLIALFGSIIEVHAFAALQFPGKPVAHGTEAPDFSVACLKFESGLVARLTCGVVAPRDHQFKIYGADGVMTAEDCWFYDTPVAFRRWIRVRRRFMLTPWKTTVATVRDTTAIPKNSAAGMDFARGPIEVVKAMRGETATRVPLDFCVHFTEVALAIHNSAGAPGVYHVRTRCESFAPLEIAQDTAPSGLSFLDRVVMPKMLPLLDRL